MGTSSRLESPKAMSRMATATAAIVLRPEVALLGRQGRACSLCATIARMSLAAVLFDNDGLTLDTEPAWTRAEAMLFARHGATFTHGPQARACSARRRPMAAGKLEAMLGVPGDELNAELYELVLEEVAAGRRADARRRGAAGRPARRRDPGRPGLQLARGASSSAACAPPGWTGAFAVIVTAEEVARPKPAPDAYVAAAVALGAAPAECAVLEDSPTGVAAGRAAGALTIGVPSLPGVTLRGRRRGRLAGGPGGLAGPGARGGGRLS